MFPSACSIEVRHCLAIAEGDVGRAAQLVLHRQEAGQSLMPHSGSLNVSGSKKFTVYCLLYFIKKEKFVKIVR